MSRAASIVVGTFSRRDIVDCEGGDARNGVAAIPKQGNHSVGVAHQYCGRLGKQDNCQVAVSLSLANSCASLPVAYRLYLPKDWADERLGGGRSTSAQGGRPR
jgi:hypothetical protein